MTDTVTMIPVAACRPSPSARPVLVGKVVELVASIREVGLRQPINVRPLPGGEYEIRGGGHRVAAFVELGRETIPAFVREDDDLRAELAEIDENLIRNELGPADRASAIARRKAIYEALHPETRHGAIGGNREQSRQVGDSAPKAERFTKATADATGSSERTVQREAERGEKIGEEALRKVAGTSLDKGEELDALAKLPEERRNALIDRAAAGDKKVSAKVEAKKDRREMREAELGKRQAALPDKRYGVILADPEWRFEPWSRETGLDRAADNHYPTSALEVIQARPVESIAAKDCVLFLWATAPMMPHAVLVMAAWGFNYASQVIWAKDRIGTGYWFRNKHELLLVGTRGDIPAPAMGTQWPSIVEAPVGRHSEKPEKFYELIEAYYPTLPKMELNARVRRLGWDAWGFEAPGAEQSAIDAAADQHGMVQADPTHRVHKDWLTPEERAKVAARAASGASLPPDIGVGVCDEPFSPHDVSDEIANPAGEKIRSAQGQAMEPPAETGQPPVAGGSPDPVAYTGRVVLFAPNAHATPPHVTFTTEGGPVDPAHIATYITEKMPAWNPLVEVWHVYVDGALHLIRRDGTYLDASEFPAAANAGKAAAANTEDAHVDPDSSSHETSAGVPRARAPASRDEDLEIPAFLRVGTPENDAIRARSKRDEGEAES